MVFTSVGIIIYLLMAVVIIGSIYIVAKSAIKYTRDVEDKKYREKEEDEK